MLRQRRHGAGDRDCDGLIDCADTQCNTLACGANGRTCAGSSCACSGNGGVSQTAETVCGDGRDNDCDGLIDCVDPGCATRSCGSGNGLLCLGDGGCSCGGNGGVAQTAESTCTDGFDNDCDGLIDCRDGQCVTRACGAGNGLLCLGDGGCSCSGNGGTAQAAESTCNDSADNDCDGLSNCADTDCSTRTCSTGNGNVCQGTACSCSGNGGPPQLPTETTCGDGADNDCDGTADCADTASCNGQSCGLSGRVCQTGSCVCGGNGGPAQSPELSCSDTFDNDCDGLVDCADGDCAGPCASMCSSYLSTAHADRGGRGVAVELAGRPRLLFVGNGTGAGVEYVECTAGCSTASPTWSAPLRLDSTLNSARNRAVVVASGTTLLGAWKRGTSSSANEIVYSECPANCSVAGSWASLVVSPASGSASAVDVRGALRAVAYERADGGAAYAQCTSACTASATNWTTVGFPMDSSGGSMTLFTTPDGGTGSAVAFGSSSSSVQLMYGECLGACGTAGNWATLNLGVGYSPVIVADSQRLPRVFFNVSSQGTGGVSFRRCTARPCTTAGNWAAATSLTTVDGYAAAMVAPDGGTVLFANGSGSVVRAGVESGTTYALRTVTSCDGGTTNLTGAYPVGLAGPANNYRVFFGAGPTRYFYEGP